MMPDANGKLLPSDPGYIAPTATAGAGTGTGLINAAPTGAPLATPADPVAAYDTSKAVATPAAATGYDPTAFTVSPNATVADQIKGIVASDSPLMQQAEVKAREQMNARGLINSSQGIEAGQNAVLSAALPIAQADASTYNQAATNTANAKNVASQFGAGATNTANLQNSSLDTQASLTNAGAQNTALSQASTAINTVELQKLKGDQATTLATIEAQYKDTMQTSASAAQIFATTSQNINAILADPNTSVAQKQAAVNSQNVTLQNSLAVVGGIAGLNLGSLLDFSGIGP